MAVLLVAVLHFIGPDEDPYAIVGFLQEAMAPGSYLVVSHVAEGILNGGSDARAAERFYQQNVAPGSTLRSRDDILRFFATMELVEPGLVQVPYWRPDEAEPPDAGKVRILGAVGRKPFEAGVTGVTTGELRETWRQTTMPVTVAQREPTAHLRVPTVPSVPTLR